MKEKIVLYSCVVNVIVVLALIAVSIAILPASGAETRAVNEALQSKLSMVYVGAFETMPPREMLSDLKATWSRYVAQHEYTQRARSLLYVAIAFLVANAAVGAMALAKRKPVHG